MFFDCVKQLCCLPYAKLFSEFSTLVPAISNVAVEILIRCKNSQPRKHNYQLNPKINFPGVNRVLSCKYNARPWSNTRL